ncbi:MAG: hypothetical protein DRJ31_07805 [Candidatus Methanomethylicota archaeon]|uniref:DUF3194 domain-containing protein n=1 Tax=Thermoproteota archaeon TaxID=2056631 RepID=A0A497ENZ3_9CREN|nr:MAG: hypothetical protein DRJ31_07805 [Candidatus Verstraetearchaeota archaeon]
MSLGQETVRQICEEAEKAARKFIFSKVKKRYIRNLIVEVLAEQSEEQGLQFTVSIELDVHPIFRGEIKKLVDEATNVALKVIDNNMKVLKHEEKASQRT